jgi:hypothetical protein
MDLRGLDGEERSTIEEFFRSVEGRLRTFTYLDPMANLLEKSEDFAAAVWQKAPALSVSTGETDPDGGSTAALISNPAPVPQTLGQTRDLPGWFHYTWSIYVRAELETAFTLLLRTNGGVVVQEVMAVTEWRRVALAGSPATTDEQLEALIELSPGTAILIYGAQLEAQPAASSYKRSVDGSGVYHSARLLQDEIVWTATDNDVHNTTVRIASR